MPMYLIAFPLLIIPFVLYNMIAFLLSLEFSTPLFNVPLLSERSMSVNTGDMLVILAVLLLYLEILKATRLSSKGIMDHVLSMILFPGMAIEFIAVRQAATSTFLILVALAFVDVIGGFTISIRTAQRSVTVEETDRVVTG
jgi:energy-coupling factor transporter transmembrane protein EcfT